MNRKMMYYKPPVPQRQSSNKPPRPKPEWNMQFGDPNKYKLSQVEMIERKASLQSKNMEAARQQLAERRRKLEEGIVDEETRKIYETALISKRIDPNPSLRRNLSQMINYEKQRLSETQRSTSRNRQMEGLSVDQQLKNTKEFIKKMERASKAKDVIRAVEILEDKSKDRPIKKVSVTNMLKEQSLSPLENIEKTLQFMEKKLFKTNVEALNKDIAQNHMTQVESRNSVVFLEKSPELLQEKHREYEYKSGSLEMSQIPHDNGYPSSPLREKQQQQDWMSTIRRMNTLMEKKEADVAESLPYFQYSVLGNNYERESQEEARSSYVRQHLTYETKSNQNVNTLNLQAEFHPFQEKEVQFSLTVYNDNSLRLDTDQFFQVTSRSQTEMVTELKMEQKALGSGKCLIQEVDPDEQQQMSASGLSFYNVQFSNELVKSIQADKKKPAVAKINPQAERIKSMIMSTKKDLQRLSVQKLEIPSGPYANNLQSISLRRIGR